MVDLSGVFGAAFAGIYDDAVLYRAATPTDDGSGSITRAQPTEFPCKIQIEAASTAMRAAKGFVETDVRLLILTASLGTTPTTDDEVEATSGRQAGVRWKLMSRDVDPASGAWDMRGRVVSG